MTTSTGRFRTPKASGYLQQLCKHFGHKVEATFDERSGAIAFPAARATLEATDEALSVTLEAEGAEALERMQGVIDSHLARFAFREGFERMDWEAA